MALAWLPLDEPIIDSFCALARLPWDRASLDDTWRASGLYSPDAESVSHLIYEEWEYMFHANNRIIRVSVGDEPIIAAFWASFCLYYEPEEPNDTNDLDGFAEDLPSAKWKLDKMAPRGEFDAKWAEGCNAVERRLDRAPDLIGVHFPGRRDWGHSIWRIGSRLIVVMQNEDVGSYSLYKEAALWVADFPADRDLPHGDEIYPWLVEGRSLR